MADKELNQRRSTRQERPLYQAGPKNEQRSKLTHSRDASVSSSGKLGTPPASMEPPEKLDPMEAVGKKLAEMSMRGPPGYFNRSSNDKARNYQNRPYTNNNNTKNNNQQINNYTTNNNRDGRYYSSDFSRQHSTESQNGGHHAGDRFNTFNGSRDSWDVRSNGRVNERHSSMPNGGFHDRGSRNDEGRNSSRSDNQRNSGNTHFESDRLRTNQNSHNSFDGGRSDRFRDPPARNHDSHDYHDRNDRQGNWRSSPRQNEGGSWRRGPNSQQGDFHRGYRDNHRRLLNDSRDSLHSISSARSNDSRMKRRSPIDNYSQNQSRYANDSAADSPKNWIESDGRRTSRDDVEPAGNESQNHNNVDQTRRSDRNRRDRRKRSRSQNKKPLKSEPQDATSSQEPREPTEQSAPRLDWCEMADSELTNNHEAGPDLEAERVEEPPAQDVVEPEVAEITEKAPEQPSRIDWSECPTPPPLEDTCAPCPVRDPTPEPIEVEVKVNPYPEESWRNPRSRQTSESSSGQTSNCSGFRQWERQRDGRNQGPRGGRRSPPRDDYNYSSFHRRAPSPGCRYQDSKERRPYERYGNSQGKRFSTFQDSLPPRFRKQKENRV